MEKIEPKNLNSEKKSDEQEKAIKEAMAQISEACLNLAIAEARFRCLQEYKNTPEDIESSRKYFEKNRITIGDEVLINSRQVERHKGTVVGFYHEKLATNPEEANAFLYAYRLRADTDSRKLRIGLAKKGDIMKKY